MQQNKDDDVYGYTQGMIYEHVSNCKDNFKCKRSGLHYISVIWIGHCNSISDQMIIIAATIVERCFRDHGEATEKRDIILYMRLNSVEIQLVLR